MVLLSLLKDQDHKSVLNYVEILSTATKKVMISQCSVVVDCLFDGFVECFKYYVDCSSHGQKSILCNKSPALKIILPVLVN